MICFIEDTLPLVKLTKTNSPFWAIFLFSKSMILRGIFMSDIVKPYYYAFLSVITIKSFIMAIRENLNGHKENDCIVVSISEDQREKALKAIE